MQIESPSLLIRSERTEYSRCLSWSPITFRLNIFLAVVSLSPPAAAAAAFDIFSTRRAGIWLQLQRRLSIDCYGYRLG